MARNSGWTEGKGGEINFRDSHPVSRYDFSGVVEWFAERVDVILLMFDAHKLDISDEFRSVNWLTLAF